MSWTEATVWAGALCTLAMLSLLYRENPVYRFFEYLFIGVASGYTIREAWRTVLYPKWWQPMVDKGQWWLIFPFLIGLLYYTIYMPKYVWFSRLLIGTLMGLAAGMVFKGLATLYLPQVYASFVPLFPTGASHPGITRWQDYANNWVITLTLLCVMIYFFFSFKYEGVKEKIFGNIGLIGRWLLMISFGAIFGQTVMARMAIATSRFWFLLHDWLKIAQ